MPSCRHAPLGRHLVLIQNKLGAVTVGARRVAASTHSSSLPHGATSLVKGGKAVAAVAEACACHNQRIEPRLNRHPRHQIAALQPPQGSLPTKRFSSVTLNVPTYRKPPAVILFTAASPSKLSAHLGGTRPQGRGGAQRCAQLHGPGLFYAS